MSLISKAFAPYAMLFVITIGDASRKTARVNSFPRSMYADWLLPMSKVLIYAASLFGTSQGGVIVEVSGQNNNADRNMCLSVFANERGEVIPSILPSLATQMILRGEIAYRGIVP